MTEPVTIVHTSDIHLGSGHGELGMAALQSVITAAQRENANMLLLAGDIFDNNRVDRSFVREVAAVMGDSGLPTIILPGNHDCLTPDAIYRESCFEGIDTVHVLGLTTTESLVLPKFSLEVWGRAHLDYEDMTPLTETPPRTDLRWHVGMAHGHFVRDHYDEGRSYLIRSEHLDQVSFDYVALGHWDVWTALEHAGVPVYYSGSPQLAKSVNLIYLDESRGVHVVRRHLPQLELRSV
jgi:DNA repair exonuclease SbcCD nuclease subunit